MVQVVDTSVWVSLERAGRPVREWLNAFPDQEVVIAAITASELLAGAHLADTEERRKAREQVVTAIVDAVTVVPFDLTVAHVHAKLWVELTSRGEMIGAHDLQVAATAMTLGHSVMTHNVREFRRVPGLTVVESPV